MFLHSWTTTIIFDVPFRRNESLLTLLLGVFIWRGTLISCGQIDGIDDDRVILPLNERNAIKQQPIIPLDYDWIL